MQPSEQASAAVHGVRAFAVVLHVVQVHQAHPTLAEWGHVTTPMEAAPTAIPIRTMHREPCPTLFK